jgi:UDP-N-acetyl-D-galactosamine dehydrogenase
MIELSDEQVKECLSNGMKFTLNVEDCNIYVVTVPSIKASETVGRVLKKDDIVIYEYPGATEEDCVPVLEKLTKTFFAGIAPSDKEHTVTKILKVTSLK